MSSYDQSLLDSAPKATRAQLQEGYNVDLLEPPPPRRASVRSPLAPLPLPPSSQPLIEETTTGEKLASVPALTPTTKSQTSFWRTRNGAIAVLVIVLLVIGAVVGGAVGGTVKKSNNTVTGSTTTSSSAFNPPVPSLVTIVSSSPVPSEITVAPQTGTLAQGGQSAVPTGQNTGNSSQHIRR